MRKKRLYFKFNIHDDDSPILYNCFNCGACGVLTPTILRDLNVFDSSVNKDLVILNSKSKGKHKTHNINKNINKLKNPLAIKTDLNIKKKEYIESRLGIKTNSIELNKLKVVFSLTQFLETNNVYGITTYKNIVNKLDIDSIGFLSSGNEIIIFRDITGANKFRYNKYNIFNEPDIARSFYSIPSDIDITSDKPLNINLAEGVFDILGIYFHLYDKDVENNLYIAVMGASYMNTIKYLIHSGLFGNNITINIYSDSDKDTYYYESLIKEIKPWVNKIRLFYNDKEKDYGVPKEYIELREVRI
jgi:hypothetical protein